ncbi:hypothetical protein ACIREE_00565 [Streptomyces sp. NPDC102467]|uniref:hypothetical protein n=1 Tax=Streptomyces sp. NPDC102467 TaxID=3366179 RepID=UPI0037FB22AD
MTDEPLPTDLAPGGRASLGGRASSGGPASSGGQASLGELLAAAVRPCAPDADGAGELRALAAFRAARDGGAVVARPRRGDDWRPRRSGAHRPAETAEGPR